MDNRQEAPMRKRRVHKGVLVKIAARRAAKTGKRSCVVWQNAALYYYDTLQHTATHVPV
jgi:hypothetical protein